MLQSTVDSSRLDAIRHGDSEHPYVVVMDIMAGSHLRKLIEQAGFVKDWDRWEGNVVLTLDEEEAKRLGYGSIMARQVEELTEELLGGFAREVCGHSPEFIMNIADGPDNGTSSKVEILPIVVGPTLFLENGTRIKYVLGIGLNPGDKLSVYQKYSDGRLVVEDADIEELARNRASIFAYIEPQDIQQSTARLFNEGVSF